MGLFTKMAQVIATAFSTLSPNMRNVFAPALTNAGESVNLETVLQLDAVWACARLIARQIASLPLELMAVQEGVDSSAVKAVDHPLYNILRHQPNADMTATTFWEAVAACLMFRGNAYAQKTWSADGTRLIALTLLYPDGVRPWRNSNGDIVYSYSFNGPQQTLTERDVFHVKGFSLDGLIGLSPLYFGRQTFGTSIAAEKSAASWFRNGMRPTGYLSSPTYLKKEERDRGEQLMEKFTGTMNAGRPMLLEGGWKWEQLTLSPEDSQMLQTRQFSVEQICRWFDVPPPMIGHMQTSTAWGTGLEQMQLWFLNFTLRPWLTAIESEIRRSLLSPQDRTSFAARFDTNVLMRADAAARIAFYVGAVSNGIMSRNQVAAMEGLPPFDGGDIRTVQAQMVDITKINDPKPAPIMFPHPGFPPAANGNPHEPPNNVIPLPKGKDSA